MKQVSYRWFYENGLYARWRFSGLRSDDPINFEKRIDSRLSCRWAINDSGTTIWLEDPHQFHNIKDFLIPRHYSFFDAAEDYIEDQQVTRHQYYRRGYYARWYILRLSSPVYEFQLRKILLDICEGKFHIATGGVVAFEKHEDFFQATMML